MEQRRLKRPPALGSTKRAADAEAPALRSQLRTLMRLDHLDPQTIAINAGLDVAALSAFLDGASLTPGWQQKLARWVDAAIEQKPEV
jgi:hypothetical protein